MWRRGETKDYKIKNSDDLFQNIESTQELKNFQFDGFFYFRIFSEKVEEN